MNFLDLAPKVQAKQQKMESRTSSNLKYAQQGKESTE
jgi:hypothetical protein